MSLKDRNRRRIKLNAFVVVVLSPFLFGCGDDFKKQCLTELELIEKQAQEIHQQAFDTLVPHKDQETIASVVHTLQKIKDNYQEDTIAYELAKTLDAYKEVELALTINEGNIAKAKQAISESIESIQNLQHDIEKGVNDRTAYPEYIQFEQEKLEKIEELLNYYITTSKTYQQRYDTLHSEVNQFSLDLIKN